MQMSKKKVLDVQLEVASWRRDAVEWRFFSSVLDIYNVYCRIERIRRLVVRLLFFVFLLFSIQIVPNSYVGWT